MNTLHITDVQLLKEHLDEKFKTQEQTMSFKLNN